MPLSRAESAAYRRKYPDIHIGLPAAEVEGDVDQVAGDFGTSRAGAARALIRFALAHREEFYAWMSTRDADKQQPRIAL